jgi:hypothetical protein
MEVGDLVLKNSLSKHFVFHNLVETLIKKIKEEIPKFEELKLNIELTLLCCNIVENSVKKKTKVDKEKLVVDALTDVFSLQEPEQKTIKDQIEFLFTNGRIVKVDETKKFFKSVGDWFVKKFG